MKAVIVTSIATLIMMLGCSNNFTDPVQTENDFGESVRKMQRSQIYNDRANGHAKPKKALLMDGEAADSSIESYRKPRQ